MSNYSHDTKTALTVLKLLIVAVALLNFPGDVLGKDYDIRLMEGKTRGVATGTNPAGEAWAHIAWTAKFRNYDVSDTSAIVEFNVRVMFLDEDGMLLYDNSLTKAKVKSGKTVEVKGMERVTLAIAKRIASCNFKLDRSRQELNDMLKKITK